MQFKNNLNNKMSNEIILSISTLLLAIFTFVLAIFTYFLWSEAKKKAENIILN